MNIYSIREIFADGKMDNLTETEKFFNNIQSTHEEEYHLFKAVLKNIKDISGAKAKFFRDETNPDCNYLRALIKTDYEEKHYSKDFRLFCLRFGNHQLILGNGGIKKTKTFNEDPNLNTIARVLQKICAGMIEKEINGELHWNNSELISDTGLIFEID